MTRGNHYQWKSPDKKTIFYSAGTPSDHRALENIKSRIRRAEQGVAYGKVVLQRA